MRRGRIQAGRSAVAYLYVAPFIVLFLSFGIFPILYSLFLSFTYWKGLGAPIFVFLDNYIATLRDPAFFKALYNTAYIWICAHILILPGGFLIAYVLNTEYVRKKNLHQALLFTPMVTSTIAVSIVFTTLFGEKYGMINFLLGGLGVSPVAWFHGTGSMIKPVIITLFVWKWVGWNCVIYFAGMQGIDRELYECAEVEGANKRDILRYVTVPLMRPIILYTLILSFIGGMQIFDEAYILTGGGQGAGYLGGSNQGGLTIALLIYETGFRRGAFGQASAIAYFLMLIIVVLSIFSFRFLSERGESARA
jgi:cellobiose transport system permease protein